MRKRLKITFESDWHIGSGFGIPGSVDRSALRDADGLPYVPGKTLTGILRDSAEFVASVRDRAENGTRWRNVLRAMFGDQVGNESEQIDEPLPAGIGIGDATVSPKLGKHIVRHDAVRRAMFIVQPGIMIDRSTGRAKDDHLFTREEARGGVTLYSDITINDALGVDIKDAEKLLSDAAKAARRIGGHRRRGGGKCKIEIQKIKIQNGNNTTKNGTAGTDLSKLDSEPGAEFIELEFVLETLKPVIVHRAALGNIVQSESFIPGTYLLQYFTKMIASQGACDSIEIRRAITRGEFSVGPFFREINGKRPYPVPMSFAELKEKDNNEQNIFNRIIDSPPPERQTKDIRSGFMARRDDGSYCLSPAGGITMYRTHNTVDDAKQHPTDVSGGPFTYQAIKPGMRFRGIVRISNDIWEKMKNDEKLLDAIARGTVSIGQSRKDEYGLVLIECVGSAKQAPLMELKNGNDTYIAVYLESDVLSRNAGTLAFRGDIDDFRRELAGVLEMPLDSLEDVTFDKINPLGGDRGHCVRMGRRESWHSGWGLPRPSLVYLQAGSVFLFKAKEPGEWDSEGLAGKAKKLLAGVGDRVGEGYGRVLLNPDFLVAKNIAANRADKECGCVHGQCGAGDAQQALDDADDAEFLKLLKKEAVKTAFRRAARRYIEEFVNSKSDPSKLFGDVSMESKPSPSQFGILREIAAAIFESGNTEPINQLFDRMGNRRKENNIWDAGWRGWLRNVTDGTVDLWKVVGDNKLLEEEKDIKEKLKIFAIATFLDILCEAIFDKKSKEDTK